MSAERSVPDPAASGAPSTPGAPAATGSPGTPGAADPQVAARLREIIAVLGETGREARLRIVGTSMLPLLKAGCVVAIAAPRGRVRRGEIVVFTHHGRIVAHRVVGHDGETLIASGDNTPGNLERIGPEEFIGRVVAVYERPGDDARRLDGPAFRRRGRIAAVTRAPRAVMRRGGRTLRRTFQLLPGALLGGQPAAGFTELVAAFGLAASGRPAGAFEPLAALEPARLVELAQRHRVGSLLAAAAAAAPGPAAASVAATLRGVAAGDVLTSGRVAKRAADVVALLRAAAVPAILLKGGARAYAYDGEAVATSSVDVDVIVPREAVDDAVAALVAAGYGHRESAARIRMYRDHYHHRATLYPPDDRVPVEVHVELVEPHKVSRALDYAALRPMAVEVDGAAGPALALGPVAAALHLAYHGRHLDRLRDLVLLATRFASFEPAERAEFDAAIAAEKRDRVRLQAAVALAELLRGRVVTPLPKRVERYLGWALVREAMPVERRRHATYADAWHARNPLHLHGLEQARQRAPEFFSTWAYTPAALVSGGTRASRRHLAKLRARFSPK